SGTNNGKDAVFRYAISDWSYLCTNKCYVRAWTKIEVSSGSGGITVSLKMGDVVVGSKIEYFSSAGSRINIFEGWVDLPAGVGDFTVEFHAETAGIYWAALVDGTQLYFGSPPDAVSYVQVLDEKTGVALDSAHLFYCRVRTGTFLSNVVPATVNSTGYLTIYSWHGNIYQLHMGATEFDVLGADGWYRCWWDFTNGGTT
ncbi:MAG: hypothetical protein QHG94_08585, partial [Candidatus Methanosuratincola sp.]|nr:hypothetical protein [Candidatus Methanosuratincola sp.]